MSPWSDALDARLESLFSLAKRWPAADPVALGLATHRRAQAYELERRNAPKLAAIEEAVVRGDARAVDEFDRVVAAAIDEMRAARPLGNRTRGVLGAIDRLLYRDAPELLDDPSFPKAERVHVLHTLDRMNVHMGSYDRWIALVSELVATAEKARGGPVVVHDLAAGHGGFALALKERLGARVSVVASDIADEYLELGRADAAARGVDVDFQVVDATSLASVRDVDVFTCTQSVHHFPPGMVARMIGEAARVARTAVCFIDAERGVVPIALIGPLMAAYGRSWPVVHDTIVSLRRMYFEEELALLARMAPGLPSRTRIDSGRFGPGYAYVRCIVG